MHVESIHNYELNTAFWSHMSCIKLQYFWECLELEMWITKIYLLTEMNSILTSNPSIELLKSAILHPIYVQLEQPWTYIHIHAMSKQGSTDLILVCFGVRQRLQSKRHCNKGWSSQWRIVTYRQQVRLSQKDLSRKQIIKIYQNNTSIQYAMKHNFPFLKKSYPLPSFFNTKFLYLIQEENQTNG